MKSNLDDLMAMLGGMNPEEILDTLTAQLGDKAHEVVDAVCGKREGLLTPYKILGLDPGAPDDVVELVYKFLAKKYHPDIGGSDEKMKVLNVAYGQIMKERKKA